MLIQWRPRFTWERPVNPPAWVVGDKSKAPYLWIRDPHAGQSARFETYHPDEESGLWRSFEELGGIVSAKRRRAKAVEFVKSYGALGLMGDHSSNCKEDEGEWWSESDALHRASELWTATKERNADLTLKLLTAHPDYEHADWLPAQKRTERFDSEVIRLGKFAVGNDINLKFEEHDIEFGMELAEPDNPASSLQVGIFPRNLIGFIWLQFARAVEGNRDYQQCQACGRFFEIGSNQTSRSDKKFCTPTCKANAHRRLKEEILQMHERGMRVEQIAKSTSKDIAKIREWIQS